jgi:hypothetical protein
MSNVQPKKTLDLICPKLTPSSSRSGGSGVNIFACWLNTIRISTCPKRCEPTHLSFHSVLFRVSSEWCAPSTYPISLHAIPVSALGVLSSAHFTRMYRIDCSLKNKTGVDRIHCWGNFDHSLLIYRVLVEFAGSGRALPTLRR